LNKGSDLNNVKVLAQQQIVGIVELGDMEGLAWINKKT
jgi:hypothetical protein